MNIGLIGFGTVGEGVWRILEQRDDLFVKYVLDIRDLPPLGKTQHVKDLSVLLNDPEIDTVVELIGGEHPALEFICQALNAGKNVVTANKYLLCLHYDMLLDLAGQNGVTLRFTAAAGGGIPWLVNLSRAERLVRIDAVSGIMNGTTNYILDAMQTNGDDFAPALKEAQRLGFAEADPTMDIDGHDTCHKTVLSANIAFGVALEKKDVPCFGIRSIEKRDLDGALQNGCTIKLIGKACRVGGSDKIAAFVEPTVCPLDLPEGNIHGCDNIITFDGEHIGKTQFIGAGAGRFPTGYAVAQDLIDLAENAGKEPLSYQPSRTRTATYCDLEKHRYYLRTDFTSDPFYSSLKTEPWGAGVRCEPVSVSEMHAFARRALDAGKSVFFAGFQWN